jgi:hypothetical protein
MSENTNNRNDEIDLLDLFRRMGRGIANMSRAIGRGILISIVFLLQKWIPLGISLILGIGISYLISKSSEAVYSSDMTLRNNAVPIAEMISYINRLQTYCQEGNTQALSDALSLDQATINNIAGIGSYWIIDRKRDGIPDYVDYKNKHDVYDTINIQMRDRFNINVKIKSPQDLFTLKKGILAYINSDSLFQQRNRLRLKQNLELQTRLNYDILQLDSLQKVKYFEETRNRQPQSGGQMIFLQEQKTQLIYNDIYTLYDRKQSLESQRDLYNDLVTVLSDFSIPAKRENGGLYFGKKFIPIIFFSTLLLLILIHNRKKIKEIFEKY